MQNVPGKGFGLLFEMGCGKTLTAIAIMGALYEQGKAKTALIVAPGTVCPVWPGELSDYAAFPYQAELLMGEKKKRLEALARLASNPFPGLKVAVINYESIFRDGIEEALTAWDPDIVVADESQRIKTYNAKQSKAMHAFGDRARYKLILTGTPIQNNAVDFWSQYRFLDKSVFGQNFFAFRSRYCIMGGFERRQIVGYRHIDELKRKAHGIAYRVTKDECLDLPEQTFTNLVLDLSPSERRTYDQLRKASVAELEAGKMLTATTVLTKILRLQQMTGGFVAADDSSRPQQVNTAKIDALSDILDDYVLDAGKKLVIFARFRPELSAIAQLMDKKGIRYGLVHGDVSMDDRGDIVKDFQENQETMVFLAQLQTANFGITLTAASTAVFYSWDYNYASYQQATARIHRIGQKQPCTYIHLVVRDTIDEKVLKALNEKRDIATDLVDNWREFF